MQVYVSGDIRTEWVLACYVGGDLYTLPSVGDL